MEELYKTLKQLKGANMEYSEAYTVVLKEIARRKAQSKVSREGVVGIHDFKPIRLGYVANKWKCIKCGAIRNESNL